MKKTIMALLLAMLLVMALAVPAMAEEVTEPMVEYHCFCGATAELEHMDVCPHKDNAESVNTVWTAWNGSDTLEAGNNYYLTGNVELTASIAVSGTVGLDLNGHTISAKSGANVGRLFNVQEGAEFTLTDTVGTGKLDWTNVTQGFGGAFNLANSTVNMYGGTITGDNTVKTFGTGGAAVCLGSAGGGVFNMHGGTISNGKGGSGGNVLMRTGTFNMYGGTISGGTATGSGGNVQMDNGTFTMSGEAVINGGAASGGGAIRAANNAVITMSDKAQIIGGTNTGTSTGGSVSLNGNASLTMSGSTKISKGKTTYKGGGVIIFGSAKLTMSGDATITECVNTADSFGGGVHVQDSATLTVSGNARITGNTNKNGASNVYLANGRTVTIGEDGLGDNAYIGITMADGEGTFTDAGVAQSSRACFTSDNYDYAVKYSTNGLYLFAGADFEINGTGMTWEKALATVTNGEHITMVQNVHSDIAVTKTVYLDLNGYVLTGDVTVADGATLYVFDSATADYVAGNSYGKIVGTVTGNVARTMLTGSLTGYGHNYRYLTIQEADGVYSFHRIYLAVKSVILAPTYGGRLNYNTVFKCDEVAAEYVSAYGVHFADTGKQHPFHNQTINPWSTEDDNARKTAINGFLVAADQEGYTLNESYAELVYGVRAYITVNGETVCSATLSTSLENQVEDILANYWIWLTIEQRNALKAMYDNYNCNNFMADWTNIERISSYSAAQDAFCICRDATTTGHACATAGHKEVTWTAWSDATALPTATGNYYLTGNVTAAQAAVLTGSANVVLDLNGYSVSGASYEVNNAALTITTRDGAGQYKGTITMASANSVVNVYSGILDASAAGCAVSVNAGKLNVYGGAIVGGKGDACGSVYVADGASVHFSGNVTVSGGRNSDGNWANVYLADSAAVSVGNSLTGRIGITLENYDSSFAYCSRAAAAAFTSDKGHYAINYNFGNLIMEYTDMYHCECGAKVYASAEAAEPTVNGTCIAPCDGANHTWQRWTDATTAPYLDGYWYLPYDWNLTQATNHTYHYIQDGAVKTLNTTMAIIGRTTDGTGNMQTNDVNVFVDLNGYTITGKEEHRVFRLEPPGSGNTAKYSLTITDSSAGNTGTIRATTKASGTGTNQGMIIWTRDATNTVNIYGGNLDASKVVFETYGAAICNEGGTVNLYGGTVKGGTANGKQGGAIYCRGNLGLYGGTVIDGTADIGNGIYCIGASVLKVSGAPVANVYLSGPRLTIDAELTQGASIGVEKIINEGTFTSAYSGNAAAAAQYFHCAADKTVKTYVRKDGSLSLGSGSYRVGYSNVDISVQGLPLRGYGDDESRVDNTIDTYRLSTICLAVTDATGETVLLFSVDSVAVGSDICNVFRNAITAATGIPQSNIMISAVHQHSTPTWGATFTDANGNTVTYQNYMKEKMVQAAQEALTDRAVATMQTATVNVGKSFNFVRNYMKCDKYGTKLGMSTDNHEDYVPNYDHLEHESAADNDMQIVKFVREGANEILMTNFQVHPHLAASANKKLVTSDIIGVFRAEMEAALGCEIIHFNGAGGNINPTSRISGETVYSDHVAYGKALAQKVISSNPKYTAAATGTVSATTKTVAYNVRLNSDEGLTQNAIEIAEKISNGTLTYYQTFYRPYGIYSSYHANRIVERKNWVEGDTRNLTISAVTIGDVGFIGAPYEMFDTNGMEIKTGSPFAMTIISTLTNGGDGYIPSALGFKNGGYSTDISRFEAGTGEKLVAEFVAMLEQLHD